MSTIQPKQVAKILTAPVRISAFSANGGSNTLTSAITSALATAGNNGLSVPLQVSANVGSMGVIASSPHNRVEIYSASSKAKLVDGNLAEVYGRLTESGGTYTLTYYSLAANGTETGYSFSGATPIDLEFNYRFDFNRYPADGAIAIQSRNVSQDPAQTGSKAYTEQITVSGTNTLANLAKTPESASNVLLIVNGIFYDSLGGSGAFFNVSPSTKALTWNASNAGFSLETTDRIIARYFSNE